MQRQDRSAVTALVCLACVGILPLAIPSLQGGAVVLPTPEAALAGKVVVISLMLGIVVARCRWDVREQLWPIWLCLAILFTAVGMTLLHYFAVDWTNRTWQYNLYFDILNNTPDADGPRTPHQYRPLPYGIARSLEWLTGDWLFSCLSYRVFFTYWFVWASARLARRYLTPAQTYLALTPLMFLYPYSIQSYWGQLTDPLSHSLFVMSLDWVIQKRFVPLLLSLMLGVLAKETVVLVVAAYAVCEVADWWALTENRGRALWGSAWRTLILGLGCVAAFLAVRVPRGWRPGNRDLNGMDGSMLLTNLNIGEPIAYHSIPVWFFYEQGVLFFLTFVPLIVVGWRDAERRLKLTAFTLAPLILFTNLAYSWASESRNYMPIIPLFSTLALLAALGSTRQPGLASEGGS